MLDDEVVKLLLPLQFPPLDEFEITEEVERPDVSFRLLFQLLICIVIISDLHQIVG